MNAKGQAELVAKMVKLADTLYTTYVQSVLGDEGVAALRAILEAVKRVYEHIPCELLTGGMTVFVDNQEVPFTTTAGSTVLSLDSIAQLNRDSLTIEVLQDGSLRVWSEYFTPDQLPQQSVCYHYRYASASPGRIEKIYAGGDFRDIESYGGTPSAFSVSTFDSLNEVLEHYRNIVNSPDRDLDEAWREANRLGFLPKPEKYMRRSLERYLRASLRGGSILVRPEQNVDESHPVDIEVTWSLQKRLAWIEIKWMGDSAPMPSDKWSTPYRDARAVEGAQQLADYLDSGQDRVTQPVMGYLVVYDARRRALDVNAATISHDDGMHYELRDVVYPTHILQRPDFAPPVRLFLRPKCERVARQQQGTTV
jgi:hypothetical protein